MSTWTFLVVTGTCRAVHEAPPHFRIGPAQLKQLNDTSHRSFNKSAMGLLPPRKKSNLLFKTRLSAHKRPDEDPLVTTSLPLEAQQLKTRILEAHPESCLRFSVSRMRHIVAQLPVEIPAELRGKNLVATRVAGHNVPFTRGMWDRKMTLYRKRMLDIIGDGVHYH